MYSISNSCIPQLNHRPSRRSLIEDSRDSSESAKSVVSSEILVTGIFYVVHNFAKSKRTDMKKRIITGLVALTSMVSSAAAQDI